MATLDARLSLLEQRGTKKGRYCPAFSILMVRPNGQTPEERAAFDAAVQQARNEGRAVSVYDEGDPAYTADLERFLG